MDYFCGEQVSDSTSKIKGKAVSVKGFVRQHAADSAICKKNAKLTPV